MSSSFRRSKPKTLSSSSFSPSTIPAEIEKDDKKSNTKTHTFRQRGTKPWTGGLTLTSSGHREMDSLLGGGQPLGTAVLLEVDRWTEDLGLILARYWSSEAVSQGQTLLLAATKPDLPFKFSHNLAQDEGNNHTKHQNKAASVWGFSPSELFRFVRSLPRDLHLDKFRSKERELQINPRFRSALDSNIVLEEEHETETQIDSTSTLNNNEEGLKIAWQYSSQVQRERSGLHNPKIKISNSASSTAAEQIYCHSYDLNGQLIDQHGSHWKSKLLCNNNRNNHNNNHNNNQNHNHNNNHNNNQNHNHKSIEIEATQNQSIDIADFSCTCPYHSCKSPSCGFQLYKNIIKRIQHHLSKNESTVVRLLILNAPSFTLSIAMPLLLSFIRENSLPVVMLVTVHPWLHQTSELMQSNSNLQCASDAVFHIQGFSFSQHNTSLEFRDLTGLLAISKMSLFSFTNYADHRRPPTNRYGLKRDRRKLQIQMLHLPPEEFSTGGSSVSAGGVRSGAGRNHTQKLNNIETGNIAATTACGGGTMSSSPLDF